MNGLLDCPFCGSKAEFFLHQNQDGMGGFIKCTNEDCGIKGKSFSQWIWVNRLGFFDEPSTKEEAKKWWNKRQQT